jgi:hypothetical protein
MTVPSTIWAAERLTAKTLGVRNRHKPISPQINTALYRTRDADVVVGGSEAVNRQAVGRSRGELGKSDNLRKLTSLRF